MPDNRNFGTQLESSGKTFDRIREIQPEIPVMLSSGYAILIVGNRKDKNMAFNDIELQRIKKFVGGLCTKRTPAHLRDKLRLEYDVEKHNIPKPL